MDDEDITFTGVLILLLRCIGMVALIAIPCWLCYKLVKWIFFD